MLGTDPEKFHWLVKEINATASACWARSTSTSLADVIKWTRLASSGGRSLVREKVPISRPGTIASPASTAAIGMGVKTVPPGGTDARKKSPVATSAGASEGFVGGKGARSSS